MPSLIKLEKVNFYYDKGGPSEVHALKDINLEIQPGEFVSFFGPSGCGKSSILYIISGIEQPQSGKVIINGQNICDFSPRELAIYRQIGVGIIFQNFNLIPSIKNMDNVGLPMAFLGISSEKRKERVMEIFERLGIVNLAERYPYEISGGQQQRVGIARALANDPPILLADEPIGNLDSVNANNVLAILKELNKKDGKNIIMVTHEAWSLRGVDTVYHMRDGSIVRIDTKEEPVKKVGTSHYNKFLFPKLPTIGIRAKTLASLVLRGYSKQEIDRLENFLNKRFGGEIDERKLRSLLDKPFKDGGVGLWSQKAGKIADYVEKVINKEEELGRLYKKLERSPEAPLAEEIERIRIWLLEGFAVKLSSYQIDCFDEAINERVRNIITPRNFREVLDLPKTKGGVGLRVGTAMRISERLETILGRENMEEVMVGFDK